MVDRIKKVMEYKQMSTKAFADTIGLNPSSMTHIFNGRNQPSLDVVKKILTAFPEVKSEWLIMGLGEMLDSSKVPSAVPEVSYSTVDNMQQADLFSALELEAITPAAPVTPVVEVAPADTSDKLPTVAAPVDDAAVSAPKVEMVGMVEKSPTVAPVAEPVMTAPSVPVSQVRQVVAPVESPNVEMPVSPSRRGRNSESHNSARESKRERISNSQGDKKLVKIVMFYDDRSFEEYFPN